MNFISGYSASLSQIVTHGEKIPRGMIDASSQATDVDCLFQSSSCQNELLKQSSFTNENSMNDRDSCSNKDKVKKQLSQKRIEYLKDRIRNK